MKLSLLFLVLLSLISFNTYGQVEISQNNNGLNNKLYPVNGTVNKSWSVSIYKPSDIGQAGSINKIAYQVANACNQNQQSIKIYMLNTSIDSFSSMSYADQNTLGATQVYSGNVYWNGVGWKEISLDNNFVYNGVDNLMIFWTSNGTNGTLSSPSFQYHNTDEIVSKQAYENNNFPNNGGFRSMHKTRPNIKLFMSSSNTNNLGLSSWLSPGYGATTNSTMTVTLKVKNVGTLAQSGYSVKYSIDNGQTWITKSNLASVANGTTTTVSFNAAGEKADMSNSGLYHCIAVVSNVGDTMQFNDTLRQDIYINGSSMSSSYTIGKDTASDFPSIESALRAVRQCGISNHITFKIKPGVYDKQTHISAISGLSSSKTITFESFSGNAEDVVFQYQSFVKEDNFVLKLDTVSYIKFHNLTFTTKGTVFSRVVHLFKSSHITFDNNIMYGYNGPEYIIDNQILFLAEYDNYYAQTSFNDIYIKNNTLRFGSKSIEIDGGYNIYIDSNDIAKPSYTGIFASCDNLQISNNTIRANDFYGVGLYIWGCNSAEIYNNRISNNEGIALELQSVVGTSSNKIKVYNNFISQENQTVMNAVYLYQSQYIDFFYNNILVKGNNSSCGSIRLNSSRLNLHNNNSINLAGGYAIRAISAYSLENSDYNNYYTNGNELAKIGGSSYSNISSYSTGTSKETHSLSVNTSYISDYNLHLYSTSVDGMGIPIAGYTTDIDGQIRNATSPDIGADEFSTYSTDATPIGLFNSICGNATQDIIVNIKNVGINAITDMVLGWSVDGVIQSTAQWTGSISTSNNAIVNLGSSFIAFNSQAKIKIWIDSVNTSLSLNSSNDTLFIEDCQTRMKGVFQIGKSANADFFDIKSAINSLYNYGVCGPVIFNIEDGIYYGQYQMTAINGVDSINTVTFQSLNGNPEDVRLINYTENEDYAYIFEFDSISYITIKDVFFHYNDSYDSRMLWIKHKSHHITIDNCTIEARHRQYSSMQNLSPIHVLESEDISIINSRIYNGEHSIFIEGISPSISCKNIQIINNEISGFAKFGINILYAADSLIIKGNKIIDESFLTTSNYSSCAIRIYKGLGHGIISNNIIQMKSKSSVIRYAYGIYIDNYNYSYSSGRHLDIYNNYINIEVESLVKGTGVYLYSTPRTRLNFNTIKIESGEAQTIAFQLSSGSNVSMKNNLFDAGNHYVLRLDNLSSFKSDYNCFYSSITNSLYHYSYKSFANYQNSTNIDSNSIFHNPTYHLGSDFHINDTVIDGKGINIPFITDDIDGDIRSITSPDIGADEFEALANDVAPFAINMPSVNTPIQFGINPINIALYNAGHDILVSANIHYQLDTSPMVTTNWTGSTLSNSSVDSINLGNVYLSIGIHTLKIWTSLPNGFQDQNSSNDTMTVTFTALDMQSIELDKTILNDTIINCSESINMPLIIRNTGGAVLNYTENHSSLSWVHLATNTSGSILPGDSVSLNYVFNSIGLAEGLHTGNISITSNDINNPIITIPCELTYYKQYNNAVELGADTTLCADNNIILDAGAGFTSYLWSTGSTSQSITVDSLGVGLDSQEYMVMVVNSNNCIGYDTIQVSFVYCIGIDANAKDSMLVSLFPNPITNTFNLSFSKPTSSELTMIIYNTIGSEVRRFKIPKNSMIHTASIGNLSQGAYFYQVLKTNKILISRKLIVK